MNLALYLSRVRSSDLLGITPQILVDRTKHHVPDRRVLRICVLERVAADPLHHHRPLLQDLFLFYPSDEARVNIEMLIRISKHYDARPTSAAWYRQSDNVT